MASQAASPGGGDRRWATAALMLATAMQAADATIITVALPQLERSFGVDVELGAWVVTSYLCAAAVVVPLTGWLRRRLGPERLFRIAMALFIGASLLCALAPSAAAIILFRVLQGAGGGVLPALSQAVLHDLYPRERQPRILAIWGAAAMVGPMLGPVLGGVITDLASWRWAFAINVPLGLAALWWMRGFVPRVTERRDAPFDALGLLLLIIGVGTLQLCLKRGVDRSWLSSPELLAEAAITVVALAALAVRARRSGPSILRVEVFGDWTFAAAAFLNFTTSALLFASVIFLAPLLLEGPLGYSPTVAGVAMLPRGLTMLLMVLGAGQVVTRIDYRIVLAAGSAMMVAGLAILAGVRPANGLFWIVIGSSVQAMGSGLIFMPLSTFAFATLPIELRTDAAGLYSLMRQIGSASGVALMAAILHVELAANLARLSHGTGAAHLATARIASAAGIAAYSVCFEIMAVAALIVTPAILFLHKDRADRAPQELESQPRLRSRAGD